MARPALLGIARAQVIGQACLTKGELSSQGLDLELLGLWRDGKSSGKRVRHPRFSPNFPTNSLGDLGQVPSPLWALVTLAEPEEFGNDDQGAFSHGVLGVWVVTWRPRGDCAALPQTLDKRHTYPASFIHSFILNSNAKEQTTGKRRTLVKHSLCKSKEDLLGSDLQASRWCFIYYSMHSFIQ